MKSDTVKAILEFQIDDPSANFNFSSRLAQENGWTEEFSKRVVNEYRRFLVLCAEAGHKVTPSDAVDQAWHLHLCYTENYWDDLCGKILKFPLHHGPTKGGVEERVKFSDWYSKTLDSYRKIFKEKPPKGIWPSPKKRFKSQEFRRINCSSNFILSKKTVGFSLLGFVVVCLVARGEESDLVTSIGLGVLSMAGLMVFIFLIIGIVKTAKFTQSTKSNRNGGSSCGAVGCSSSGSTSSGCSGGCGGGGCGGGCGS